MQKDEIHYKILKAIEANPSLSQRELAAKLGISLGKANYCLQALIEKGWVKAGNFKANPDKRLYAYLLTPSGVKEKARVTLSFLQRKMDEYEQIKQEIARLKAEAQHSLSFIPTKTRLQAIRHSGEGRNPHILITGD